MTVGQRLHRACPVASDVPTDNSYLPATSLFFFFTEPATTGIYTLSLHDALPISRGLRQAAMPKPAATPAAMPTMAATPDEAMAGAMNDKLAGLPEETRKFIQKSVRDNYIIAIRSEEHTSELQSRFDLVCRLLLEK